LNLHNLSKCVSTNWISGTIWYSSKVFGEDLDVLARKAREIKAINKVEGPPTLLWKTEGLPQMTVHMIVPNC
jgi:hypothetical protein